MKFSKTKKGYSESEVDEYISTIEDSYNNIITEKDNLIHELQTRLEEFEKKENSIATALTAAIDKAKDIEASSRNIYKLKIEQMTILYSKWELLLNEMIKKYPGIEDVSNVREDIEKLKGVIKVALKDDFNIELISKNPVTDPIRVLLSKLTYSNLRDDKSTKTKVIKRQTYVSLNDKTELNKLENRTSLIKSIVPLNLEENDKFENLVDKFLNTDEEASGLSNSFIKASSISSQDNSFDLSEAVNPSEDLEEIMKAFDFYKDKR